MSDQAPPPPPPPAPPPPSGPTEGEPGFAARAWGKYRSWPFWAQAVSAVVLVALVLAPFTSDGDDEEVAAVEATTTETIDPLEAALADVDVSFLDDDELTDLLDTTCEALEVEDSTEDVAEVVYAEFEEMAPRADEDDVEEVAAALKDAAPLACPEGVESHPNFIAEFVALTPMTTTTTTSTTTTEVPTTTAAPTTTAPPPPTTTAPPPPPPTTAAPPPPSTTEPPADSGSVHPGSYCSSPGETGYTSSGTPMTCATHKCDGTPYDQPRWRRSNC